MLTIAIDDEAFRDLLQTLQGRLQDMTPAMTGIGAEMESRVSRRFETRTDPTGKPWEKWADATDKSYPRPGTPAAIKAGRSGNARLLDRYGDMLQGLSYQAEAGSVRVGFDQSYATFHEFGTRRMPRRGLLMANPQAGTLAPDDERAVLDVLSDFLFQE